MRKLRKEKTEHGFYDDGAGKRYQIGPHYMLLDDNDGALGAFQWFEKEFPDDVGVPRSLPALVRLLGDSSGVPRGSRTTRATGCSVRVGCRPARCA